MIVAEKQNQPTTITAPVVTRRREPVRQLTASVGKYGHNRSADVRMIQQLLNLVPAAAGGPVLPLEENGHYGLRTEAALAQFERYHLPEDSIDGRIDPGCRLWKRLLEFDLPRTAAPTTLLFVRQQGPFFEVHHATSGETAIFTVSREETSVPEQWAGPVMEVEVEGAFSLDLLAGSAEYETRRIDNRWTSTLRCRRRTSFFAIPAVFHLCPSSRNCFSRSQVTLTKIF